MRSITSTLRTLALAAAAIALPSIAQAKTTYKTTYTFVGSWDIYDGPAWGTNPQVMSGRQTAAFLFGGRASDYAISTHGEDVTTIDFKAILDGWGDHGGLAYDQDFSATTNSDGGYNCGAMNCAYSAYVRDAVSARNYAFRVSTVPTTTTPEPASVAMLGAGAVALFGAGWVKRRRSA